MNKEMKEDVLFSVIIPIFNSDSYLKACIDSVLGQDFLDYEIILIDDGSTDNSLMICKEYAAKHDFISLVQKANTGQGDSRNIGVKNARGRYIMFLDSDDRLAVNCLVTFKAALSNEVDVVVSDLTKVYRDHLVYFENYIDFHKQSNINLMLSHPGPVAKAVRRELIIENGIFFETGKIFEDLLFNVKLGLNARKVEHLPLSTYNYYIRDASTMRSAAYQPKFDDIYDVIDKIFLLLKDYPSENEFLHIEHILYSASLRALKFGTDLSQLRRNFELVKLRFPDFLKNEYLSHKSIKFRVVVYLLSKKQYSIVKFFLDLRRE